MSKLGVERDVYYKRPLGFALNLIDKMIPDEPKKKKKVTRDDIENRKKVEYKVWQPN